MNKNILKALGVIPTDLTDHARAIWPKVRPRIQYLYRSVELPERFDDAPEIVRRDVLKVVSELLAEIEGEK